MTIQIRVDRVSFQMLATSTCAPRLRQGNGFKIFHYSGSLLFDSPIEDAAEELWEVTWRSRSEHPDFAVSKRKVEGIEHKQPQASKVAYRPPNMRHKPSKPGLNLQEDEPADNHKKEEGADALSKSASKNKKRRENKNKKAEDEIPQQQQQHQQPAAAAAANGVVKSDKERQLKKLQDKLTQVQKLKAQQKEGKILELNQLEKLKRESELVDQMKELMR